MSHAAAEVLVAPPQAGPNAAAPIPVILVAESGWEALRETLDAVARSACEIAGFKGRPGQAVILPGEAQRVLFGLGDGPMAVRALPSKLAAGEYRLEGEDPTPEQALAFAIGLYRFDRYKQEHGKPQPRLVVSDAKVRSEALTTAHALALARDMVNTPANDMGPRQIEAIAREIAEAHGARFSVVVGEELLAQNYPAIHAVGRAAVPERAPRMIELGWKGSGAPADVPLVAIVGKGVVFDTGGLDIKPSSGMRLMKKDMGGAAHALALGRMVMAADLPIRLAVLVPVVENAISGDAMRPGDVLASRQGLSIEVGNTDAEGRLILADALTRAGELRPALTLDFATLTGAARVALGPDVIPFYTDDDGVAGALGAAAGRTADPLWRMPLWAGYDEAIDSDIADLKNDPDGWAQAGSIAAGLFLKRFAPKDGVWVHFDIFAWNPKGRPGRPAGAEAQAIRAVFAVLKDRFA